MCLIGLRKVIASLQGLKLVDLCVGDEGDLWCNWLTGDESPTVTKIKLRYPGWATVLLAHPPLQVYNFAIKYPCVT